MTMTVSIYAVVDEDFDWIHSTVYQKYVYGINNNFYNYIITWYNLVIQRWNILEIQIILLYNCCYKNVDGCNRYLQYAIKNIINKSNKIYNLLFLGLMSWLIYIVVLYITYFVLVNVIMKDLFDYLQAKLYIQCNIEGLHSTIWQL